MRNHLLRTWVAVPVLAAFLLAGCGGARPSESEQTPTTGTEQPAPSQQTTTPAEPAQEPVRVVVVLPDKIGLNPFHQVTVQGVEKAKADFGIEAQIIESKDWGAIEENLRAVAAEGKWDLILTSGFESAEPLQKVAAEFPDQKFAILDTIVDAPNVRSIAFREHEAAFLLGAAMGLVTKTNIVGMVGPMEIPFFRRWTEGIRMGLEAVNPDARLIIHWSNSFEDVARAKELALEQHAQGADVIAAVAGGGNFGVFEAAREKGFYATGQDTNQSVHDPEHIIISQIKRLDVVTYDTIKALVEGNWSFGPAIYGLKEGGVGLSHLVDKTLERHPVLTDEIMQKLEELQNKIISGEIVVPDPLQG